MSYSIVPNIIFVAAVAGVIVMVLRRLPETSAMEDGSTGVKPEQKLRAKGLPAVAVSKVRTWAAFWARRGWHFILEAKGIKHESQVGFRIKQIFRKKTPVRQSSLVFPSMDVSTNIMRDEAYFLSGIKRDPKDLANYAGLAQIYIDTKNFAEARDIYEYLVKHDAGNPDFHAKLGYSYYLLSDFAKSADSYEKSLRLDSSHPSRYYNLGLAYKATGDPKGARKGFKKAAALDPSSEKYREALEEVEAEIGR